MRTIILAFASLLLMGCVFSHHDHLHQKGVNVPAEQVALIEPGITDRAWVLQNLGAPDRIHAEKGGLEVFEYVSRTVRKSDSDFILLFSWESEKVVEERVTRVVMREGVVESVAMTES